MAAAASVAARQDALARSPVYSWLSTSLDGLASIRAFSLQGQFARQFTAYQDANTRAVFCFMDMSRWLGLRLDLLACVFLAATAFTLAGTRAVLDPSLAGLSLVYAMNLTGLFQWMTRQSAEVENFSTARATQRLGAAPRRGANLARTSPTRTGGAGRRQWSRWSACWPTRGSRPRRRR